ncbi:MAG: GNAT family N-acetyltransferase [Methyloprofundus sp.]|nr:GNAT family N-acetyltransferase [Methyloprofundus sp.]
MVSSNYTIRTMAKDELSIAIDWAASEGWNPGLYDAESFYAADPNGFFIGEINGKPVAVLSAVKYGETFGFMGFYIVKPEYRGKGYGIQIWNVGLEYLKERNIGLDGVLEQQENYKKFGFELAYRNIRYAAVSGNLKSTHQKIVKLSFIPFSELTQFDQQIFPEKRENFLKSWLEQAESNVLGIIQNEALAAYGVIRKCRNGYKIGPLIADTAELAEYLFLALRETVKGSETIFLDIPEINKEALALVEKYHMKMVFETARMYTKTAPCLSLNKLFGVTSFELG